MKLTKSQLKKIIKEAYNAEDDIFAITVEFEVTFTIDNEEQKTWKTYIKAKDSQNAVKKAFEQYDGMLPYNFTIKVKKMPPPDYEELWNRNIASRKPIR